MKSNSVEAGVGLIEVMVAILLLSVAVLGFSALQLRAISATDESLLRTQALSVIRGLAENMRANSQQIDTYQQTINDATKTVESCTECTAEQIAINESKAAFEQLNDYGISVKMVTCPGTADFSQVKCVIAAWRDTKPLMDDSDNDACANENGIYNSGSNCIIVETY
ncbi:MULTISPECIES: type IV pilus modification protein PilV [unclassified Psychrobacter]|uniref:type IV pilus modification protein PilV n=1 Tax=unclassified Psychrobacter TaxID=196806 RepID=UPI000868F369|nr:MULTISPECIES: type IV pilus modification protein PilV [unclassified Psychrobacter]OEH68181.1 MAG: type IV pilus modification protein PilV [Psychrobacter sp. B29-1]PKG67582.1 type IV pilus modification protein PilV [Psychrobacter sp. Choline-02u-13]PKH48769.1 type IV pilus modification protein PilV [Psychrobacter sp. Choline-02u-9]|tara:strand:- start:8699 stop:9199 length:501 start_codon:yes stop_codon:yes gene_type:complete